MAVVGDADRLHQVLMILLLNARDHTPEGTRITLVLGVEEMGSRHFAVLSVRDDGPGIAPEFLPHIFDRFARGDESRSRAAGSTGLGTANAQAITHAHGGEIEVASESGNTVVTVRLPLAEQE